MSKNIAVLFSGGLDSTYLVWKNLQEGNIVTPVYIDVKNNVNKVKLEEYYSEKLMNLFNDEFGDKIKPLKTIMSIDLFEYGDFLQFKQVPIWIFGLLWINDRTYDEIQVGYIAGDDAVGFVDDIEHIYYSFNKIMSEQLPLKFPLMKIQKYDIIRWLPKKYIKLTYSCENPIDVEELEDGSFDYKLCGNCPACKKIIHTDKFGFGLNERELLIKEEYYKRELDNVNIKIKYPNGELGKSVAIIDGEQLSIQFDDYNEPIDIEMKELADELVHSYNDATKEKIFKE